jgi:hypothetical protein
MSRIGSHLEVIFSGRTGTQTGHKNEGHKKKGARLLA